MALTEKIEVEILNDDLVETFEVGSISSSFHQNPNIVLVSESVSEYFGDDQLPKSFVAGNNAYGVIETGLLWDNGIEFNYVKLDRPYETEDSGENITIANTINEASWNLNLSISTDRLDSENFNCVIKTSGDTEYGEKIINGYVAKEPVLEYESIGHVSSGKDLFPTTNIVGISVNEGTIKRGQFLEIEGYSDPFKVVAYSGGNAMLNRNIPPVIIAETSGDIKEYSGQTDQQGADVTGLNNSNHGHVETGGTTLPNNANHDHNMAIHVHTLTRTDTITYTNETDDPSAGVFVQIAGIMYKIDSVNTGAKTFVVQGGIQGDIAGGQAIYYYHLPNNADVKSTLWRNRAIINIPPIFNFGLGLYIVKFDFYLNETDPASATSFEMAFHRASPKVVVQNLGENEYRLHFGAGMTPGEKHLLMLTNGGINDVFSIQNSKAEFEFDYPPESGWNVP